MKKGKITAKFQILNLVVVDSKGFIFITIYIYYESETNWTFPGSGYQLRSRFAHARIS